MSDFMFYQDYYDLLQKVRAIVSKDEMDDLLIEIVHSGVTGERYKSPLSSIYLESIVRQIISRIEISKRRKADMEEKRLRTASPQENNSLVVQEYDEVFSPRKPLL